MKKRIIKIKIVIGLVIVLGINLLAQTNISDLKLMPMPAFVKINSGEYYISKDFGISINMNSKRLSKAAVRALKQITDKTGIFIEKNIPVISSDIKNGITINIKNDVEIQYGIDESYELSIAPNNINISAENTVGAIYGLATLVQLIDANENGYYFPNILIKDKPRFSWRGLLIDVSRHFQPVEVIKRNLDGMAALKMNVLHWHLTDDHGFRIECNSFPKLHELGSDGLFYTQEQIKDIIEYAADRGIRVMPEFDLPGHATSWLVGYPELASSPGPYELKRVWGIFNPTFDPTNEETYSFLETFFTEMAELFPDKYWHIGGDENNGKQWDANPEIQEFMTKNDLKDNHALQNYFNVRIDKILSKLKKTMVGWYTDEMPDLSKDYIVQAWKGRKTLYETAKNGYRSLLSHGFYIDLVQTTEYHYLNDPIPADSILSEEVKDKIIGGEATMWAEFVGPETIDSRIWPRTAAIAERLWSPGEINDVGSMFKRLEKVSLQLEGLGLTHIKNYDMMLRRITNSMDIDALKNFVDVIQPLYTYSRDHPHVFRSYYPLTRVVDISRPDPDVARKFKYLVDDYLGNKTKGAANDISKCLMLWQKNHEKLDELIKVRPILKEIESLSSDLSICAGLGLKAIEFLEKDQQTDEVWVNQSLSILETAGKPRGETELAVIEPIRKLVKAVEINK